MHKTYTLRQAGPQEQGAACVTNWSIIFNQKIKYSHNTNNASFNLSAKVSKTAFAYLLYSYSCGKNLHDGGLESWIVYVYIKHDDWVSENGFPSFLVTLRLRSSSLQAAQITSRHVKMWFNKAFADPCLMVEWGANQTSWEPENTANISVQIGSYNFFKLKIKIIFEDNSPFASRHG